MIDLNVVSLVMTNSVDSVRRSSRETEIPMKTCFLHVALPVLLTASARHLKTIACFEDLFFVTQTEWMMDDPCLCRLLKVTFVARSSPDAEVQRHL